MKTRLECINIVPSAISAPLHYTKMTPPTPLVGGDEVHEGEERKLDIEKCLRIFDEIVEKLEEFKRVQVGAVSLISKRREKANDGEYMSNIV